MSFDNYIDSVAALTKRGIEINSQTRDSKELAKANVDCLAAILKIIAPFPTGNLNSLDMKCFFEWVRRIKEIAQQCPVDKVVLLPYPSENQNVVLYLRVYGVGAGQFFEAMGRNPEVAIEESDSMAELERNYGIILYEGAQ